MSVQELDAALSAPDTSASRKRLGELVTSNIQYSGNSLPSTAVQCLRALCSPTVSAEKRRWAGLALCKLVHTSASVSQYLKAHQKELSRLGQVIFEHPGREDTRIVAGLVIRQLLHQGIEFASCWPTAKIPDNVPFFPVDDGIGWMLSFQTFLDTLHDLKLTHALTDSAILYVVSVTTSDGFNLPESDPVTPIALIQGKLLTIIASDQALQKISFMDIPLHHIQSAHLRKSSLHDSQEKGTDHEPWDIVLSLKPSPRAYCVNASEHAGNEITIMFQHRKDAIEWESCIREAINMRSQEPKVSGSSSSQNRHVSHGSGGRFPPGVKDQDGEGAGGGLQEPNRRNRNISAVTSLTGAAEDASEKLISIQTSPSEDHVDVANDGTSPDAPTVTNQTRASQKSGAGTLAKIKKTGRSKGSQKGTDVQPPDENDDFVAPDDSPHVKPQLAKTNGKSGQKATTTVGHRDPSKPDANSSASASSKLTGPKPKAAGKPTLGSSERKHVMITEDDEQDIVSQGAQILPRRTTGKHRESRIADPEAAQPQQGGATASKPSGLPKPTRVAKEKRKDDEGDDVYTIPREDETKPRKRRKVVKKVTYNGSGGEESESPESGDSDPDYTEPKHKKGKRGEKQAKQLKESGVSKGRRASHSKGAVKSAAKKTRGKIEAQSISPAKHPVLSTLLSKPKLVANTTDDTRPHPNESHGKGAPARPRDMPSSVINHRSRSSEAHILGGLNEDEIEAEPSPLASRTGNSNKISAARSSVRQDTAMDSDDAGAVPPMDDSPAPSVAAGRKRPAISTPISSQRAKRTKPAITTAKGDNDVRKNSISGSPTTPATPKPSADDGNLHGDGRLGTTSHTRAVGIVTRKSETHGSLNEVVKSALPPRRHQPAAIADTNQLEDYKTPFVQGLRRTDSAGSRLSSNSKPVPGSPTAESKAISGYANTVEVEMRVKVADTETAKNDPFVLPANVAKSNSFTRRLREASVGSRKPDTDVELAAKQSAVLASALLTEPAKHGRPERKNPSSGAPKPPSKSPNLDQSATNVQEPKRNVLQREVGVKLPRGNHVFHEADDDIDGSTLIAQEEEAVAPKPSPISISSSPPQSPSSPSSHSSTSAEPDSDQEKRSERGSSIPPISEEEEWEASLQPHQRAIGAQLSRVTKRVLRHIVDNETAVTDIAETYGNDGATLVEDFHKRQEEQLSPVLEDVRKKKVVMKKELLDIAGKLRRDTKQPRESE